MSVHVTALIPKILSIGILLFAAIQSTAQISESNVKNSSSDFNEPRYDKTIKKAETLWKRGEFDKAISIYENLASADDKNTVIFNTLGSLYAHQKRYREAVSVFTKALNLNPEFAMANYNLSVSYFHLKQFEKSLPPAQRAAQLKPNHLKIRIHLCELKATIAKDKNAINCFEALDRSFKPNPRTRLSFALLLIKTDNLEKASSLLEDTVKIFPENPTVHNVLGMAYLRKKMFPTAIKKLRRSIEIDPKLSYTRFNLAYAYLLNKNKKAALEQYQILKKLDMRLANKFYRILYSDKVIFVDS